MPGTETTQPTSHRDNALAILHYETTDNVPVVHFGFWTQTLLKWADEGHLSRDEAMAWGDGNTADVTIGEKLGFDFNWYNTFSPSTSLNPGFEPKIVKELPDGSFHRLDHNGAIILDIPGAGSIPAEIDHTLKDRASWEEHYKWRFEWRPERVDKAAVRIDAETVLPFDQGGCEHLKTGERDTPLGLMCGSLYGEIRNILGVEGASMMSMLDPDLFTEIIDTAAEVSYLAVERTLETGAKFDFGHFWEDICFKNGPLIQPALFAEKVGPHYKRITDLLGKHGIDIVSLDCDGMIDHLVPVWLENGVNTMFPIEVGTWNASIAPWREKYGRDIRGVGGTNKTVFARDRAAVDDEVDRLKALIDLGGFIPCPDHRIAPDAEWDLVRYYCDRMRQVCG